MRSERGEAPLRRPILLSTVILVLALTRTRLLTSVFLSNVAWLAGRRDLEGSIATMSLEASAPGQVPASAREGFLAALALDGRNASALAGLGLADVLEGEMYVALSRLRESVEYRPSRVTLLVLGNLMQAIGNAEGAIQYWQQAGAAPYFYTRGRALESSGDKEKALMLHRRAIRVDPGLEDAYIELGRIYFEDGDFRLASRVFSDYVTLYPTGVGYGWLGRSLEAMGDADRAIQAYAKAAELGELWHGCLALGDLYLRLGEYARAESWYLRARAEFPGVALINLRLGDLALIQDRDDLSWHYIEAALEQAPANPTVAYGVGRWHYQQRNYTLASEWLERALDLGLEVDYWFHKTLGNCYREVGDCEDAVDSYLAALQLVGKRETERKFICMRLDQLSRMCSVDDSRVVRGCE